MKEQQLLLLLLPRQAVVMAYLSELPVPSKALLMAAQGPPPVVKGAKFLNPQKVFFVFLRVGV